MDLVEALVLSPEDYKQSDSVSELCMFMYLQRGYHLGIFCFYNFALSIFGFIFKNKNFFLISKSLAPSGFVFNIIALVTGSIWGKPTWGTWWAWDARITSMLILALFYIQSILIIPGEFEDQEEKAFKISTSIITILGIINVPIIKYSVDWWSTLYINLLLLSILTQKSSIHSHQC